MTVAVAFGLFTLLTFTAFVTQLAERAVRRQAEAQVRSTAALSARLVSEQSLRFGEVVSAFALRLADQPPPHDLHLTAAGEGELAQTLTGLVTSVEGIRAAAFVDPQGRLIAREPPNGVPRGTPISNRDAFEGALRSSPYQSVASIAPVDKKLITAETVAVRNRRNQLIGVLTASENHRAQRFADRYGRELGAQLTVTDQAGNLLGQTGHSTNKLISLAADPLVAAALHGRSGVTQRRVGGRDTVSGYAAVPSTGWTVVADVPTKVAFHDVSRLRLTMLIGAGVVALLMAVLIPLLVGRLGRARYALDLSESFQRDLLPATLPAGVTSHYVASERRLLLGGDFLDVVELPDGGLAVMIGDVCGHGPRAAALGATIRAGWQTMAAAGAPLDGFSLLDQLVENTRRDDDLFATTACIVIAPDRASLQYVVAGHPPPLLVDGGEIITLDSVRGPALGIGAGLQDWRIGTQTLQPGWSLALYTDGLIETRTGNGRSRLGIGGLQQLMQGAIRDNRLDPARLMALVASVAADPDDDVAVLIIDGDATRPAPAPAPAPPSRVT